MEIAGKQERTSLVLDQKAKHAVRVGPAYGQTRNRDFNKIIQTQDQSPKDLQIELLVQN